MNQPIDSFVERQHLYDYLPVCRDIPGTSPMDTTFTLPNTDGNSHSTPNYLASSLDSGFPHSSLHIPLSFQSESPRITSQLTTSSLLPRTSSINPNNFHQQIPALLHAQETPELYEIFPASGTGNHTSEFSLIFYYLSTSFSTNHRKSKKLAKSIQTIPMLFNALVSLIISFIWPQNLVFLYSYNIWCSCTITTSSAFRFFLKSAMTHNKLVVFKIFLYNSLTKTLEVDNTDNMSQELIVFHYDGTKTQDNRMYPLNKVVERKNSPGSSYIAPATVAIYQKKNRSNLSATMCSVKVHVFP